MRYYPINKDASLYIENINEWDKYQTCNDLADTIERRQKNICGTATCARFFHPDKAKTSRKKKKKKKKEKKKEIFVRQKTYDQPAQKIIRFWNDLEGKNIDLIRKENLNWPDWKKTRLTKRYLPCNIRPTFIKILQGIPPPLPYALTPINLVEVRAIRRADRIAEKLAKKLAKEKKKAAKLAKLDALRKGKAKK